MTLSVVIPTKNRPQELLSILDSIGSQTHLPDQLIIIDQSLNENTIEDKINLIFKNKILLNITHEYKSIDILILRAMKIGLPIILATTKKNMMTN